MTLPDNDWMDKGKDAVGSPYVNWWLEHGGEGHARDKGSISVPNKGVGIQQLFGTIESFAKSNFTRPPAAQKLYSAQKQGNTRQATEEAIRRGTTFVLASLDKEYGQGNVPNATFAHNEEFRGYLEDNLSWLPPLDDFEDLEDGTVIVGVIDTGIALGHNRWRFKDGSTRILAAWQQAAERPFQSVSVDTRKPGEREDLPFGRELTQKDLNELLDEFGVPDRSGPLDEDAFNRAAGCVDFKNFHGHRELSRREAHGTHVLDIAAGYDPATTPEETLKKSRIIAVNMPDRATIGLSGTFIDYFALIAVMRIASIADMLWVKKRNKRNQNSGAIPENSGFPIVINYSFGKQAGSKQGGDFFARGLKAINDVREDLGLRKIDVVIPVGNDNLLRCNAVARVKENSSLNIPLRVLPEDQTSNYVEVWSGLSTVADGEKTHFSVGLKLPNNDAAVILYPNDGQFLNVANFARIYYDKIPSYDGLGIYHRYVICIAPTNRPSNTKVTAPSGLYHICIENRIKSQIELIVSTQTDQSLLLGAKTGLRSYFDHSKYEKYGPDGALLDSYKYPTPGKKIREHQTVRQNEEEYQLVLRHGTMNSTAMDTDIVAVAGHHGSDGKPANYSATGIAGYINSDQSHGIGGGNLRQAPTASLPSDDGLAHFGTIAAGAANGSMLPISGTSFSAAQATRLIASELIAGKSARHGKGILAFYAKIEEGEQLDGASGEPLKFRSFVDPEKCGLGRLKSRAPVRVPRFGQ